MDGWMALKASTALIMQNLTDSEVLDIFKMTRFSIFRLFVDRTVDKAQLFQ